MSGVENHEPGGGSDDHGHFPNVDDLTNQEIAEIPETDRADIRTPEFDAGSVVITALSDSPEGFEVATHQSIGRTSSIDGPLELNPDQRARLAAAYQGMPKYTALQNSERARSALNSAIQSGAPDAEIDQLQSDFDRATSDRRSTPVEGEIKFNGGDSVEDAKSVVRGFEAALDARRALGGQEVADEPTPAQLETDLEQATANLEALQSAYKQRGKKIGIRNISVTDNTITADVLSVPFPVYSELSKPENSQDILDLSRTLGAAMILHTADDRFIIQHRAVATQRLHEPSMTRGNASYTDIPGASAAGWVDSTMAQSNREPGTPDPIDTTSIKGLIYKEAGEELGLSPEQLEQIRIVGLAEDKVKPHDEFLLIGFSNLTAERVREASRTSTRNKNLGDADFEEKFFDIEASPRAVEILAAQVQCPLPPTHAAALVAAGYSLEVQEHGVEAAEEWKRRVEAQMQANYRLMDEMVSTYYAKHPESHNQVPERFWGKSVPSRNVNGYDPSYTPNEQGLPSLIDEMVRTGLVQERRQLVDSALIFDVDGVLTSPETNEMPPALILEISEKLQQGIPIGLNTGRSTGWVKEHVIERLLTNNEDRMLLSNLVVIGEKGGTWTHFDDKGNEKDGSVKSISMPEELKDRVKSLIEEKYSDCMFIDETKQTMLTVEMRPGFNLAEFTRRQAQIVPELAAILSDAGQTDTYNVDATTIATDIESSHVSKALGAQRFLQWLDDLEVNPGEFEAVGDSLSDLAMADELDRRGKKVKFVFVGDPTKFEGVSRQYDIETHQGFDRGTLAYLDRLDGHSAK